jgi:integrase
MPLTVLEVQKAKPKEKPYKLGDGGGLYLLVKPNGGKYWRVKYHFAGKERVLALGVFPDISLADARKRREEAKMSKQNGVDPFEVKQEQKRGFLAIHENTFEKVAREWHEVKSGRWSPYYAKQVMQRLENDIFPKIGHRLPSKILPSDLLKIARAIEGRDAVEIAHRAVAMCGQIFQYAIITDRATNNPAIALRGALKTAERKHRAYLERNDLPEFLATLERYDGSIQTKSAIRLLMLTFVRPSELCGAKWSEIDIKRKEWRIPAERMKMRTPHLIPLSSKAIEVLTTLKKLNGHWELVFPGQQNKRKPMSTNAMLFAIWEMGYKGKATSHGFRGTASTILNESGLFGRDVIERQLAHQERNRVRAAYDHAEHLPARQKMMQWWADYLDDMRVGEKVVSANFGQAK